MRAIMKCKIGFSKEERKMKEQYLRELAKLPASRTNAIIRAVNAKKTLEESGAKSEVEKMFFNDLLEGAKEHEAKYGKWPVYALDEIEYDDPALDIYHD